jgi:hypothetical protein
VTQREVLLLLINTPLNLVPTLFLKKMAIQIQLTLPKRKLTALSERTTTSTEEVTVFLVTKVITALLQQPHMAWSTVPLELTAFHLSFAKAVQLVTSKTSVEDLLMMVLMRNGLLVVELGSTSSAPPVLTTLTHISLPSCKLASCAHQVNTVRRLVLNTPQETVIQVISACSKPLQDPLLLTLLLMECVSGSVLPVITVNLELLIPLPAQPAHS